MYPFSRLRRLRKYKWLREIVHEYSILASDLILPIFIVEGTKISEEIKTLPDVFRFSIDNAILVAKEAEVYGINAIALFPCLDQSLKTQNGEYAYDADNLVCRAIKSIKDSGVNIGIICDVALDPYTLSGHDGIVTDNYVHNDKTINALVKQSLVLVEAGADILAPSDMMDGRVSAIREILEDYNYTDVPIISYTAKFASSLYGPFRDAVKSKSMLKNASKKTYQMDPRRSKEARIEADLDAKEGADILMVKPATFYLDVIKDLSNTQDLPIFAYHVSGEYAMLKFASLNEAINFEDCLIESMIAIKRAGAKAIISYGALEAAKIIANH
ncbi:MAG: porphobilinogen synthase [Rickettsiaceae bacterium]|nr:porphobilinogen synthase [Rickettsiaceae bacterium]